MKDIIKRVTVKRVSDNGDTSLGVLYLDGIAICGTVEDQEQKGDKIKHETRVSNGVYKLSLRNSGGFNQRYTKKYAHKGNDWHRGMLCVHNKPDWKLECPDGKEFQYILIHTGNTDDHTSGCLLPNYMLDFKNDKGSRSGKAYEDIYPILRDSILASPNGCIVIEYTDVEDGI